MSVQDDSSPCDPGDSVAGDLLPVPPLVLARAAAAKVAVAEERGAAKVLEKFVPRILESFERQESILLQVQSAIGKLLAGPLDDETAKALKALGPLLTTCLGVNDKVLSRVFPTTQNVSVKSESRHTVEKMVVHTSLDELLAARRGPAS